MNFLVFLKMSKTEADFIIEKFEHEKIEPKARELLKSNDFHMSLEGAKLMGFLGKQSIPKGNNKYSGGCYKTVFTRYLVMYRHVKVIEHLAEEHGSFIIDAILYCIDNKKGEGYEKYLEYLPNKSKYFNLFCGLGRLDLIKPYLSSYASCGCGKSYEQHFPEN